MRQTTQSWHQVGPVSTCECDTCVVVRALTGTWRIVDMELWDADVLDLLGPAFIEFDADGQGSFRFVAVCGSMDVRFEDHEGTPRVDFSWEGEDDGEPRSGRGWATLTDDGSLVGRLFFHMGDDASFRAEPMKDRAP